MSVTPPTVLDVAIWNEFGAGHVPERSFLRDTVSIHQDEIADMLQKELMEVIRMKQTKERALSRVAAFVVGLIQERIAEGISPANMAETVERKGSAMPLIDTGQLRSSITYEVR